MAAANTVTGSPGGGRRGRIGGGSGKGGGQGFVSEANVLLRWFTDVLVPREKVKTVFLIFLNLRISLYFLVFVTEVLSVHLFYNGLLRPEWKFFWLYSKD